MNKKHFLGNRVSSLELYDEIGPVTGVALLLDDENEIVAGDDSGYMLEIPNPYGTQEIADSILSNLAGKTYQGFRAHGARLSPTAELGDGITVGGVYSFLAERTVIFGPGHVSEVAAPGESALIHEYGFETPTQREFNRKIASTRSAITKTAEEIRLEIIGMENAFSSLELTVDAITGRVEGVEGDFAELTLTMKGLTITTSSGETLLDGGSIYTPNLYVDAANIEGTLTAGELQGETIYLLSEDGNEVGSFTLNDADSTEDRKLDINAPAIAITTSSGSVYLENAYGAMLHLLGTRVYCGGNFRPVNDNTYDVGGSEYRWNNIYAVNDVIQTSDRRRKKNISYGMSKYDAFFDGLRPSSYQMENGTRTHTGLVAQDIEQLLADCGIDTMEFAGFVKSEREDGSGYDYGLRYSEFIPLLIEQVQNLKAKVTKLEGRHGQKAGT